MGEAKKNKSYPKVFKECQKKEETRVDASVLRKLRKHKQVDLPANFGEHKLCLFRGNLGGGIGDFAGVFTVFLQALAC